MESQVGPYRIVERLGAGGMGEVFLAEDTRLGRLVALKRLSDSSLGDHEARSRILREAGAAATLNHPNVAAVYDVLESEGRAHIVMEFVPGETLAAQLHRAPLPLDRVVQLGLQLCDALGEAHAHGIVHRDLKPANIRVTPDGRVKVLDFGLAKRPVAARVGAGANRAAVSASLALADGQVVGTPVYMAPEVLLGEAVDTRCDIYSLGVTLFELALGHPPFDGRTFMSVALAVLTEPQPPIAEMVPGGLGEIVAKAMARDREQRYQSVQVLRRELASLSAELTDLPTGVVPLPAPTPSRLTPHHPQPISRRAWIWTALACAALALVLAALMAGLLPSRGLTASSGPVVAVLSMPTVSDNSAHANLGVGVAAELGGYLSNVVTRATVVDSSGASRQVQAAGIGAAGRELGATVLVPVVVQVLGTRVQMTAQLVRVHDQAVVGSASERGVLGDGEFFEMQQRLARRVAGLVIGQTGLPQTAAPPSSGPGTSSVDDFSEYSAALALLDRRFVSGNVDQAQRLLEGVVARSPAFAAAHAELAGAYATQFRETKDPPFVDKAIASARRAVELEPSSPRGLTALALAYGLAGRDEQALQTLRAALELQPRSDDLRRMIGEILVRRGDVEAGLTALRDAVRLRPDYIENPTALGLALYTRGRFEDALEPFARAVDLAPDDALAHQRLGATFHQLGRLESAVQHYRESSRLGGPASAAANIGTILYRQGRFQEALANYDEAVKRRPGSHQTWRSRGDALNRLGRPEEARESWQRAAALAESMMTANPSDATARGFLAVVRAKLGEVDLARSLAAQAMRAAPGDPEILYRAAVVHTLAGRLEEGRAFLDQALKAGYSASEAAIDDDLRALGQSDAARGQ